MASTRGWLQLANDFPPTLVTNAPATALKPAQTPAATGIDVTEEGYLAAGSIPSTTTKITKTYTISGSVYTWYYDRLWLVASNTLIYGAPHYTATYYVQGKGILEFNETVNSIVKILPIGTDGLIVMKSDGSYIINNASDHSGRFRVGDFMQEVKIANSTVAYELDGIVYFISGNNLYSVAANGKMDEISFPIRGDVPLSSITANYQAKYLIVGATHAYDINTKRWFNYSGTTFAYTSPALKQPGGEPFAVEKIGFAFDSTATDPVEIKYQTRCESRDWTDAQTITLENVRGEDEFIAVTGPIENTRSFQVRLTALASTVKIKSIDVMVSKFDMDSWGS